MQQQFAIVYKKDRWKVLEKSGSLMERCPHRPCFPKHIKNDGNHSVVFDTYVM